MLFLKCFITEPCIVLLLRKTINPVAYPLLALAFINSPLPWNLLSTFVVTPFVDKTPPDEDCEGLEGDFDPED